MGTKQRRGGRTGSGGSGGSGRPAKEEKRVSSGSSIPVPLLVVAGAALLGTGFYAINYSEKRVETGTSKESANELRRQLETEKISCGSDREHFSELPARGMHVLLKQDTGSSCASTEGSLALELHVDGVQAEGQAPDLAIPCNGKSFGEIYSIN